MRGNAAEWGRISVGRITPEGNMKAPFLIGRLIFGGYFIYNGINHFKQTETIAQYAGAKKVPRRAGTPVLHRFFKLLAGWAGRQMVWLATVRASSRDRISTSILLARAQVD